MEKESIAIIGVGKVGAALGYLLRSAGYPVAAIFDRSSDAAERGFTYTGGKVCRDAAEAALRAETVFITTPDDHIRETCEEITRGGSLLPGKKVIHASGVGGLDLLESARAAGAHVGSIHPIQSFADIAGAIENIPGSTFGITTQEEIEEWAVRLVGDIGGRSFFVPEKDKPLYHAAACIASNYLVTLMHVVEEIYRHLGIPADDALSSFWPLVRGTIRNIEKRGVSRSLTGPIARGDVGTVRQHLSVMERSMPLFSGLYRELGILTALLGREARVLSDEKAEEIRLLLEGGTQ